MIIVVAFVWMIINLVLFLFAFFSGDTLKKPAKIAACVAFFVSFFSMPFVLYYVFIDGWLL